ncbi:MAG: hypothetical protein K0U55_08050, partial [Gammaproteobacteria bacterium]|nr:hypothetical protein [Gammaproteobacteria bacterium]
VSEPVTAHFLSIIDDCALALRRRIHMNCQFISLGFRHLLRSCSTALSELKRNVRQRIRPWLAGRVPKTQTEKELTCES